MSVQLRIGDGLLLIADEFPEMAVLAPPSIGGRPWCWLSTSLTPRRYSLADLFWGDRHGQLEDPFGHRWNIAQHLHDVSHDEVVAAAQVFS
jgi:PhnB protein